MERDLRELPGIQFPRLVRDLRGHDVPPLFHVPDGFPAGHGEKVAGGRVSTVTRLRDGGMRIKKRYTNSSW